MSDTGEDNNSLTDAAKASVLGSGLVESLKHAIYDHNPAADHEGHALRKEAQDAAESIQQMLSSGGLDDATARKLYALLSRLGSAINGGHISRSALSAILSEASTLMGNADGQAKNAQDALVEKTWKKIETFNIEINDDFEKMHKAGIAFDEKLWEQHKELWEYMQQHPRDITKQKELDAVDDQLLHQAAPQIKDHPDAKQDYEDAKKDSDERHKVVDNDLSATNKQDKAVAAANSLDWDAPSSNDTMKSPATDVTMNDVEVPAARQTEKKSSQNFVRKQTKVCFRTNPTLKLVFFSNTNLQTLARYGFAFLSFLKFSGSGAYSVQR